MSDLEELSDPAYLREIAQEAIDALERSAQQVTRLMERVFTAEATVDRVRELIAQWRRDAEEGHHLSDHDGDEQARMKRSLAGQVEGALKAASRRGGEMEGNS